MKLFIVLLLLAGVGFAGEVKTAPMPKLEVPEAVTANTDYLYVTDGHCIRMISLKDFTLTKTIGRKGGGPGEFNGFILAYVQPDHLFVNCPGRILRFTLEGEFIDEIRSKHVFGRYKPVGKNYVGYYYSTSGNKRHEAVYIYDTDFVKVKELYSREYFYSKTGAINLIEERPPFFYTSGGKIFVDDVDGMIYVFDKRGTQLNAILPGIEQIPFTNEHKKGFINFLKRSKGSRRYYEENRKRLAWPDHYPPIRMYHVSDNRIYIMTNKVKDGGNEIIIMHTTGRVIKRLFLPVVPITGTMVPQMYTIADHKLYHLTDNEETEEWELRIHALD